MVGSWVLAQCQLCITNASQIPPGEDGMFLIRSVLPAEVRGRDSTTVCLCQPPEFQLLDQDFTSGFRASDRWSPLYITVGEQLRDQLRKKRRMLHELNWKADRGSNPSFTTYQLCGPEQVDWLLWASVTPSLFFLFNSPTAWCLETFTLPRFCLGSKALSSLGILF